MTHPPSPPPMPTPPPLPRQDPLAADPPPKKRGLSTGMIVLIVCGVLCIPVLAGLVGTIAIIVPKMHEKQSSLECMTHLSQLTQLFVISRERGSTPPRSGPGLFLEWRKNGTYIREGEESILLCPNDPAAADATPETRAHYASVDLDDPAPGLCSYAVRDFAKFPLAPKGAPGEPFAVCLNHRNGAMVAFTDGSTRFMDREELGIDPETPLTVGPDAPCEILRMMTFGGTRTR